MRLITITFPVIQYFPCQRDSDAVLCKMLEETPKRLFQRSAMPARNDFVPGGLLDLTGWHIPIEDLVGVRDVRPFWALFADIFVGLTVGYSLNYKFGVPEKLTIDQFRKKMIGLTMKEKGFGRPIKTMKSAASHKDIIAALYHRDYVTRHDPPLTCEIEVPGE